MFGSELDSPDTGYPVQFGICIYLNTGYRISGAIVYNEFGENRPDRSQIVQIPDILFIPRK